jgi:transposase
MMGRQTGDQSQLFYLFNLERRIPVGNLLRRINPVVTRILAELRDKLVAFYSDIGRPSIDPELIIRMLIVGYCYGIRSERRLCEEVDLHLAYRWFCRLDLDDQVPDHSTISVNRHGRFRDSDILRQVFEAVVRACMDAGLVKGEGFESTKWHAKPKMPVKSLLTGPKSKLELRLFGIDTESAKQELYTFECEKRGGLEGGSRVLRQKT